MKGESMKTRLLILAGLFGVVLAVGLALHTGLVGLSVLAAGAGGLLAGTATVSYLYPVAGSTPPTSRQIQLLSMLTATVHFGDTDTTAVITHNMNLTQAQLNNGWPLILPYINAPGTVVPLLSFALTDSNNVTITKASTTGTNCTLSVTLLRPDSNIT
jgi:hypothetical protein